MACWYNRGVMAGYTTHHFTAASRYSVSVGYDRRLAPYDIASSIAHARMLGRQGIIDSADADAIAGGLERIGEEVADGSMVWRDGLEDVHMNIEARLHELIGEPAGRLHTARSRNDQVATATRLFAVDAIGQMQGALDDLQRALVGLAEAHTDVLMPGYTHLQRAQPVLFAHHLMAYIAMFERDSARLGDCRKRANVLPLGSGALAGVSYPIDREWVAAELGFDGVSVNSMDAVSDRDYLLELQADAAVCMMHCSRLAEDLVLWSSQEFGFVQLAEDWVTGSSIMPQKRNPDFAELARGKTGRVYGNLVSLLTVLKGLPMAYDRDLQEDKEGTFDTVDTLLATLDVTRGMFSTLRVNRERMEDAASDPALLATDLADYLVGRGVPFREAHAAVSSLVEAAAAKGVALDTLSPADLAAAHPLLDEGALSVTAQASVDARNVPGGTARARVAAAIAGAKQRLEGSA